jgi:signal peptidase II
MIAMKMPEQTFSIIPNSLDFHLTLNQGMLMSLLSENPSITFGITAGLIVIILIIFMSKCENIGNITATGLWTIIGAGFGNFIDRLLYNNVIDFLQLPFLPHFTFNIADVFIIIGIIITIVGITKENH